MNFFLRSFSGIGLSLCSLISACRISADSRRINMFEERVGLPKDFDIEDFKDEKDRKLHERIRDVYKGICFYGMYDPKDNDCINVDPRHAKRLLILYGWKDEEKERD